MSQRKADMENAAFVVAKKARPVRMGDARTRCPDCGQPVRYNDFIDPDEAISNHIRFKCNGVPPAPVIAKTPKIAIRAVKDPRRK